MILVTGATGTVGREVVTQLLAAGQTVRAMTRNPAKAKLDARVDVIRGNFEDPASLDEAVRGVDRIFSLTVGPQIGLHENNLGQAAKTASVRHIVKLSAMGGDGETKNDIRKWHDEGEHAIREAGIPLTVLHPLAFMSNALHWRESIRASGKVFSHYGDGKLPPVHPRDIAAVAVRALTSEGHEGKSYTITGPEALTVGEQVRILANAVGKPIEYVPVSDEAIRAGMEKAGLPSPVINALLPFGEFIRSGKAAKVFDTVEEVTRRRPFTFGDWARENAAAFR
jgi:uncharacterized protein YbjT (DUF2867 family)